MGSSFCAVFLTLYFVPSISLPGHPELMGSQGTSVPCYVIAHSLQERKMQNMVDNSIQYSQIGKWSKFLACLIRKFSYICLDPVHCARVEPDQVSLVLGEPVDWYLQVVELIQDRPPRTWERERKEVRKMDNSIVHVCVYATSII